MSGDLLRHSDPRQPRRIPRDDPLIADLKFHGALWLDLGGQSHDCFSERARVVDIRLVRLRDILHRLAVDADRTPIEGRGNLQHDDLLRMSRVVAQCDLAARAEPLLLGLQLNLQIVFCDRERLPVESGRGKACAK